MRVIILLRGYDEKEGKYTYDSSGTFILPYLEKDFERCSIHWYCCVLCIW